jgi:2-iminobutanoate/2-iminopropanoate deaminase
MKQIIETDKAPAAIGPYSQAVIYNGIVYCSGQIALDPDTMELTGNDIETQTRKVMKNLGELLNVSGSSYADVLKCSIFLADMGDFGKVNEIYGDYFQDHPPARETVAVKTLPKNALVEISCIAIVKSKTQY